MKRIILTIMVIFTMIGCSTKAQQVSTIKSNNVDVKFCKENTTTNGGTITYSMSASEYEKCKVIVYEYNKAKENIAHSSLDLSRFGVKKAYDVDEARDAEIINQVLRKVYRLQKYTSDSDKYDRGDVHENIAPYITLLDEVGQDVDRDVLMSKIYALGYDSNHFSFSKGKWWVDGDCESTYLAIETLLIESGINPQRIYEVYCDVMSDSAKTTPAGGHMFGFYVGASGKTYTLEQLPRARTMQELSTERFYKMNEFRRADKPINDWKKFSYTMLYNIDNGIPLKIYPSNER